MQILCWIFSINLFSNNNEYVTKWILTKKKFQVFM